MARITVVDDQEEIRALLCRWLTRKGHEAHAATTGAEAITMVEAGGIDLVITDINMPEMDGIEILMSLRRSHPQLPVIVMSGGGMVDKEDLLRSALQLSATAVVPKPVDFAKLEVTIGELLDQPAG